MAPTPDPASSPGCDCTQLVASVGEVPAFGLYLHALTRHVERRLVTRLAALGVAAQRRPEGWLIPAAALSSLGALLEGFSPTERQDLLAAPCQSGGQPDPWRVALLER